MAHLTIGLLGPPRITLAGSILTLRLRKELALLAFLAVEQEHRHSRETLVGLLWPDDPEETARNNLRVLLANLRRQLGEAGNGCLSAERQHVRFLPESDHALDVLAYRGLLAEVRAHAHSNPEHCEACVARLAEAAEIYRGDFLAGFSLNDSAPFEEWATVQREQLHQQQLMSLDTLAIAHELRGDHASVVAYARRQLALEPWRELAYVQLMRGLWALGQRGAALEQYEACRRILADELSIEPEAETTALYEQIRGSAAVPANRPAPPAAALLHNLPAQATSFIGSEAQLAELRQTLARVRLITLTGAGGCGKTRLALAVAAEALTPRPPISSQQAKERRDTDGGEGHFRDGIHFVNLAPISDPGLVAAAIAQALDLKERGDQPLIACLKEYLRDKQMLLLLDNFEQVVAAAPLVGELLATAPGLKMLVTSREPLHLGGEHEYAVPPLPLPDPHQVLPLDRLVQYAAVQLFVARAQAVKADFALIPENAPAVAAVCQRLDGLPLAIELAAARIKLLPLQALLARLNQTLKLLTGGARDAPARQQTMRSTIDWSYHLLDEGEQRLFARLGVFVGGCALEAAEAICNTNGDLPMDALNGLAALVDKSLLKRIEAPNGEPRFTMLETIREYALERLATGGEIETIRRQHAAYYLELAETAKPYLRGKERSIWFERLEAEQDNWRAALEWSEAGETGTQIGLRLAEALWPFWQTRGHHTEGRRWLEGILERGSRDATAARAKALVAAGAVAASQGDQVRARTQVEAALAIYRKREDTEGIANALLLLGRIARNQGEYMRARSLEEESLTLCQAHGIGLGLVWALLSLGDVALDQGDLVHAERWFQEALTQSKALGNRSDGIWASTNLGRIAYVQGDTKRAQLMLEDSLALFREIGNADGVAQTLVDVGRVAQQQGDHARSTACFVESLTLLRNLGIKRTIAEDLEGLAGVAAAQKQPERAVCLFGAAEALRESTGNSLLPVQHADYDRDVAAARVQLDGAAFATSWAAGRAMPLEQAIADAMANYVPQASTNTPTDQASQASNFLPQNRNNLPIVLTPFVGREAELAELVALLQKLEVRLLTLVGVGGMGKTRLAQELGRASITAFADGVFFVPLAPISTPAALAGAIATALGITLQGRDPHSVLFQVLRQKQLLLILDNFEHLLVERTDAVDLVAELIGAAPGVRLLVTSRERLRLHGEHVYAVQALTFSATATLAEAAAAAAVRLFAHSVQRVQADFQLTPANLAVVLRICDLVQGMPLGLELAAAKAGVLPLSAIAEAIEQSAEFLTVDWRDVPERQRSMHAVFAWSWQILSAEERRILRQCAVFRGGFVYDAAQAVAGATPPLLARLTEKSLLQWQATASGEGRYTMHELLRQFAAEELNVAGERALVEECHGCYYLAYLAARGRRLGRAEPKQASSEIQVELDNVRLAWQWAVSQGRLAEIEQATYAWWQFCQFQGLGFEGRQSFAVAVDGVRRHLAQAQADAAVVLGQRLLAKLLAIHANYLFAQGHDAEMAAQAREAVAQGAACGGFEGETFGTFVLGRALQDLEHKREAGEMWQRTLQLVRRYQGQHPESELLHEAHWMAHNFLRGSTLHFGDYTGSRTHMVQALQICQSLGKRRGELYCLADLAGLDFFLYDFVAAEAGFAAALDLARALNYRRVEMVAQDGLSGVLRLRGDYTRARMLLEQAVSLATELAFPYDEALFLAALIRLYCQIGEQAAAAQRHEQLTQLVARVKLAKECQLYAYLAAAIKAQYAGATQEAIQYAEQAEQVNQQGGDILFRLVDTALILGHVRAAVGQSEAATVAFRQALDAFQQFGNRALAAEPQAGLADIALAQGDLAGAQAQVEAILPVLAEQPHAGYNNPFYIYLTCYRVLAATGDSRATALLQQGYDLLQQDAAGLDDNSRQRFLSEVPIHRNLLTAYAEMQTKAAKMTAESPLESVTLSPPDPVSLSPLGDWSEAPEGGPLYGRQIEMAGLQQWLLHDRCRLVALLGIGGVGKTSLAAAVVRAVSADFSAVVWHSLLNAPPLDELLHDVLQRLEPGGSMQLPSGPAAQIDVLLEVLRRTRCLLILDNLESILQPDQPGMMRPGYDGYAQLLRAAAERPHQSCVLLTSRERPQGLARLEEDIPLVRLLLLDGLDTGAGAELLAARGLSGMDGAAGTLVRHYSGNPLALRLIAQTVREVFDGDIQTFIETETPIFDDIGAVLKQQMARLSPLERELLTWLAIEREPVGAMALRANLVSPGPPRATIEAIGALLRRSLVAQSGSGLALQNVVTEYLTDALVTQVVCEIAGELPPGAPTADDPTAALNRFALCKVRAKDYVRASQARLILEPLAARVRERLGHAGLVDRLHAIVAGIRAHGQRTPGYAAGNILNLLLHLGVDLRGVDFSHLCVWQADLRGLASAAPNFTHADLAHSAFTAVFDLAAMAFTAAGQLLVAGVVGDELCLWRAENGQLHDIFRHPGGSTYPVIFSPDGQALASCGLDGSVRVWSTASGDQVCALYDHEDIVYALAFSMDGQRLASSSRDGTVRVWDVHSGQIQHILYEHNLINGLGFSADGTLLAGGSGDQSIRLWDMGSGQVVGTLRGHTREVESLVFSADDQFLVSGAHDGSIRVWDVGSGQSVRALDGHSQIVRAIVLHPDGQTIASGSVDRTVKLWDIRDGQILRTLLDHEQEIRALAFSPDGEMLASGSVDRTVKLWETRTGYVLDSLRGYGEIVRSVAFSPDGQLMASSSATGIVYLWDVHAQGEAVYSRLARALRGHTREIRSVAFSPDGRLMASGGGDQIVQVWDVTSGKVVRTLRGHTNTIKTLSWSPDGRLLASGGSDRTIRLWPLEGASPSQGGRLLRGHIDEISSLAFSPDGRTLLSSSLDHTARVWSLDAGEEIHVLTGSNSALSGAVFSPDGQHVIATRYDYMVYTWDVGSGQRPALVSGDAIEALLLAFSPDGEILASVARNQAIELRHVASGAVLQTLHGHQGEVLALSFSPTAPLLASSDWNGTIRLWDVASGACLKILRADGPYAGMDITDATGLSDGQRAALRALGAVEGA